MDCDCKEHTLTIYGECKRTVYPECGRRIKCDQDVKKSEKKHKKGKKHKKHITYRLKGKGSP